MLCDNPMECITSLAHKSKGHQSLGLNFWGLVLRNCWKIMSSLKHCLEYIRQVGFRFLVLLRNLKCITEDKKRDHRNQFISFCIHFLLSFCVDYHTYRGHAFSWDHNNHEKRIHIWMRGIFEIIKTQIIIIKMLYMSRFLNYTGLLYLCLAMT